MGRQVAIFTQSDTVRHIKSELGMVCPCLDVVCFQSATTLSAVLASVIACFQYKFVPSFVFVSRRILSSIAVSLVSGIVFASLEVRRRLPSVGLRSAADSIHNAISHIWVRPCRFCSDAIVFTLADVGAFYRTVRFVCTRRISKFLAAYRARCDCWRIFTFGRAVDVMIFLLPARSRVDGFSAPGAMHNGSALFGFTTQCVAAFSGACCISAMLESIRISVVLFSSYWASSTNSYHYHSCV